MEKIAPVSGNPGPDGTGAVADRTAPRVLHMLAAWRLQAAGYLLAVLYVWYFWKLYGIGDWLFDRAGWPIFNDFTNIWIVMRQALYGLAASLHDPVNFANIAADVARGARKFNLCYLKWPWPYPPFFTLMMVPFAVLPYVPALFSFLGITLFMFVAIVWAIVRRPAAIPVALALPFNVHAIYWEQTGFLRAALLGAALLALERRPLLAGVFIGCFAFKPQFGILIPVALLAARQWRAFAGASLTLVVLAGLSIAALGISPWAAFWHALTTQADDTLMHGVPGAPLIPWAAVQTVYGLVRTLHGSPTLAWLVQGIVTLGVAVAVWLVWQSNARYALKAALLSAATMVANPYGWTHDLVVIGIPVAFLAADQMRHGLLRGEQVTLVGLFGLSCAIMILRGMLPLGPVIVLILIALILRRVRRDSRAVGVAVAA